MRRKFRKTRLLSHAILAVALATLALNVREPSFGMPGSKTPTFQRVTQEDLKRQLNDMNKDNKVTADTNCRSLSDWLSLGRSAWTEDTRNRSPPFVLFPPVQLWPASPSATPWPLSFLLVFLWSCGTYNVLASLLVASSQRKLGMEAVQLSHLARAVLAGKRSMAPGF